MSINRLYTKLLRVYLFSIFTIKTPRALTALTPFCLLIAKTGMEDWFVQPSLFSKPNVEMSLRVLTQVLALNSKLNCTNIKFIN